VLHFHLQYYLWVLVTETICNDNDECTNDSCDITNGQCVHAPKVGLCTNPSMCETATCNSTTGGCDVTRLTCDSTVGCTVGHCDDALGCVYTPNQDLCPNEDPCVTSTCDGALGCVYTNVTCAPTGLFCTESLCVPLNGCTNRSIQCNTTASGRDTDCSVATCDEEGDQCRVERKACANVIVVTAAVITTAAIIGIIVGIVAFIACAGGSSYAAFRHFNVAGNNAVVNNPLYKGDGNRGTNPLYRGDS